MTIVRFDKRLAALELRINGTAARYDHLSDEELEALLVEVRASILAQLDAAGIALPSDWHAMTEVQQDRWADARAREIV